MSPFLASIRRTLLGQAPDLLHSPGVIAVSGGADSVALLRALHLLSSDSPLVIAHFNHQLRGAESDADEQFVHELGKTLALPVFTATAEVAREAETQGRNLEDMARELRYAFLNKVALETDAKWIATGHTADDQAETLLHRLIRGTGLQGLRGIAPSREVMPGMRVVRPLLNVTRQEIIAFLRELNQSHREDASNQDLRFTRNRIRHELIPLLKSFNPQIASVLNHLSEQATELFEEQESLAWELLRSVELPRAGELCILDADRLCEAPRHRVRMLFRLLWHRENWPVRYLTYSHWETIADVAFGIESASDLPEGVRIRRKKGIIQVGRAGLPACRGEDRPGGLPHKQ